MKKIFFIITWFFISINALFANKADDLFIFAQKELFPDKSIQTDKIIDNVWWRLISNLILYVAVFAVIVLVISWFLFMIAWWDEEKVKKAKSWVIWSLVWVLLSISAYLIVDFISKININI